MGSETDARFRELLDYAEREEGVLGLYVFGSRSRDGFADDRSDYDVGVVVSDDELQGFDEVWPYEHGAGVEVASTTFSELRGHAEPGSSSEWARYQYVHARVLVDKTGDLRALLAEKARLPEPARRSIAAAALDAYVNSTHRSMRNHDLGLARAARFDAADSIPPFLTAIFAMEGRVRPFNKYLEWELREHPLAEPAWAADLLLSRIDGVHAGDLARQQALFRDVDGVARARGFAEVVESWEPDVAWLRGERTYRETGV